MPAVLSLHAASDTRPAIFPRAHVSAVVQQAAASAALVSLVSDRSHSIFVQMSVASSKSTFTQGLSASTAWHCAFVNVAAEHSCFSAQQVPRSAPPSAARSQVAPAHLVVDALAVATWVAAGHVAPPHSWLDSQQALRSASMVRMLQAGVWKAEPVWLQKSVLLGLRFAWYPAANAEQYA